MAFLGAASRGWGIVGIGWTFLVGLVAIAGGGVAAWVTPLVADALTDRVEGAAGGVLAGTDALLVAEDALVNADATVAWLVDSLEQSSDISGQISVVLHETAASGSALAAFSSNAARDLDALDSKAKWIAPGAKLGETARSLRDAATQIQSTSYQIEQLERQLALLAPNLLAVASHLSTIGSRVGPAALIIPEARARLEASLRGVQTLGLRRWVLRLGYAAAAFSLAMGLGLVGVAIALSHAMNRSQVDSSS